MMSKNKPKICFVGNINSPHLEKWVNHFSQSNRYEVTVVSSHKPEEVKENIYFYVDLIPKLLRKFLRVPKLSFLVSRLFFSRFIKKLNPDILHIHQLGRFGTIFAVTGFSPLIISVWGSDMRLQVDGSWGVLKKRALSRAKKITATSEFLASITKDVGGGRLKVEVVPFGVDIKIFDPGKFKKSSNSKVVRVGFAKHLKPIYGVEILIEAFKEVSDKFNNVELLIAGEGDLGGDLKKLTRRLNIHNKVKFFGWLPNEKMPEFLSKTDIFVMPTVVPEAFGVSAIEASAMELPVVASNIGGIPEVVKNGETGILIEPKNVDDLAKALIKLIENKDLRSKMGKAGREFVEKNYDWQQSVVRMSKLYSGLIKSKKFNESTI